MEKIYKLMHAISTKQTLYLVKYVTFFIIVAVMLLENDEVFLYSALTYLVGIIFDIVSINKQLSTNVKNKLYIIENVIMIACIVTVVAIVILKFSGYFNLAYGRGILNVVLIVTTPHPFVEGLIKLEESESE